MVYWWTRVEVLLCGIRMTNSKSHDMTMMQSVINQMRVVSHNLDCFWVHTNRILDLTMKKMVVRALKSQGTWLHPQLNLDVLPIIHHSTVCLTVCQ